LRRASGAISTKVAKTSLIRFAPVFAAIGFTISR
jgi:hypothetical protein